MSGRPRGQITPYSRIGRPEAGLSAHRRLLNHIAAHKVKSARDAMRAHLADAELAWRHLDAEKEAT